MELKTYLSIVARRWWIILIVTLAIVAGAVYASRFILPNYQAVASLRVTTPLGGSIGDLSYQTTYANRLMNTYAELAASDQVMSEVKQKLGLTTQPEVNVKIVPDSEVLQITVSSSNPAQAAKIANTLSDVLISKSQVNVSDGSGNGADLAILTERQTLLQKELDQANQEYQNLVTAYSETNAKLAVLTSTIQGKENIYFGLQNQYRQATIDEAVAVYNIYKNQYKTTKDILGTQIDQASAELNTLRQQYQDLTQKATQYSQLLASAMSVVTTKQNAYQNLQVQYDEVRIADSKHDSAQNLMIASPASVPTNPIGLSRTMIYGLGVIGGLLVGLILAFMVDALDTRIRKTEQIQQLTGAPILGRLPSIIGKDRKNPLGSKNMGIQKAYWTMCSKILFLLKDRPLKTILLTSPNPGEGKSTVIVGMATGLARARKSVLVVDADMRKPRLHTLFNVPNEHGLSSYITAENGSINDVIIKNVRPGVDFLPSGSEFDDPAELLQAGRLAGLWKEVSAYDVVLMDSPALVAAPDAYSLALQMDGIILVVQRNRTTVEDIKLALSQLDDVKDKLLGSVVNRVPLKRVSGYFQQRKPAVNRVPTQSAGPSNPADITPVR